MKAPYTTEEFMKAEELLQKLPFEILPRIEDQFNSWEWPEELGQAPDDWERMTIEQKHQNAKQRAFFDCIKNMIPEKTRCRYHFTHNLGHSEQHFEDWWDSRIMHMLERNSKDCRSQVNYNNSIFSLFRKGK